MTGPCRSVKAQPPHLLQAGSRGAFPAPGPPEVSPEVPSDSLASSFPLPYLPLAPRG